MAAPPSEALSQEFADDLTDDESDMEIIEQPDEVDPAFDGSGDVPHFACLVCLTHIAGFFHLHYRYSVNTVSGELRDIGVFSEVGNVLIDYESLEGYGIAAPVHCKTCFSFLGWKMVNLLWCTEASIRNGRFLVIMDKLGLFLDDP